MLEMVNLSLLILIILIYFRLGTIITIIKPKKKILESHKHKAKLFT